MTRWSRVMPAAVALIAAVAGPATPARAQSADAAAPLFDDGQVQELRLRVNSTDWDTLVANFELNDYYPADVVWGGETIRNAGIRSRGSGSRSQWKLGLKIKFNKFVSGQQLLGENEIVLDNLYTDDSMMRERIAMKLYERLGLPAPREAFARVYVNDEYYGLYAITESVDKRFLKRIGLDSDGYLFDYAWQEAWWFTELGDDYEPYAVRFQADTHDTESAETLYGPIRDFLAAVNHPRDIAADIGRFLDANLFLRGLAVEAVLAEWDGIVGGFGANNFYLYHPSDSTVFQFLPWDKDNTFKGTDYPVWPDGMYGNVLTLQLMRVDELRAFFLDALLETLDALDAPDENGTSWLSAEIERDYQQIHDAALEDPRKPQSNDRFEEAVTELREFARGRGAVVKAFVANKR